MKMHEKYRFFLCKLYKKVQNFFCNGLKNFAIGKKNTEHMSNTIIKDHYKNQ